MAANQPDYSEWDDGWNPTSKKSPVNPWGGVRTPAAPAMPAAPVNRAANPPDYAVPQDTGTTAFTGNDPNLPTGGVPLPATPRAATNTAPPGGAKDPVAFIREWQQSHQASEGIGSLAEALKSAGYDNPRYMYGSTPSNNELVVGGQKYKVMGAENSSNPFWYRGEDDSAPGSGGAGGTDGGGSASGSFSTSRDPRSGALYDLLMKRATQGLDVNANDPIIKGQTDAFNAQGQRAAKNYETGLAERAGPNANIEAEMRSASEKVGQDTGAFQAQLMGGELSARRQEIQQALTGAAGMLTEEQRMQLQQELAQLELAERHYQFGAGLGQQESEFERGLRQRGFEFDSNDQYRNSPLGS